jgi:glycosyltransferase involved in cell wall biosynthesis
MRMMKIGIDARELQEKPTGVGRYLKTLLLYLPELIPEASFMLYHHSPFACELPHPERLDTRLIRRGIIPLNSYWEQVLLPREVMKDDVSLFFSPGYFLPLSLLIPRVVAIHDLSFEAHPEGFSLKERIRRRRFTRKAAEIADLVITDSHFSREEILRFYRLPEEKVKVVYLGVDPLFKPVPDEEKLSLLRRKLELNEDHKVILFAGSILPRRHIPELIRALPRIISRLPEAILVVAGENRTFPYIDLPLLASKLGVRDCVRFCGFVGEEALNLLYNLASVFVYLSDYEGFGLPPLEAMAAGTPVITSETSSLIELYRKAAWLLSSFEPEEIADAVVRLVASSGERNTLVDKGLALSEKFTSKRMAEEVASLLKPFLGGAVG